MECKNADTQGTKSEGKDKRMKERKREVHAKEWKELRYVWKET